MSWRYNQLIGPQQTAVCTSLASKTLISKSDTIAASTTNTTTETTTNTTFSNDNKNLNVEPVPCYGTRSESNIESQDTSGDTINAQQSIDQDCLKQQQPKQPQIVLESPPQASVNMNQQQNQFFTNNMMTNNESNNETARARNISTVVSQNPLTSSSAHTSIIDNLLPSTKHQTSLPWSSTTTYSMPIYPPFGLGFNYSDDTGSSGDGGLLRSAANATASMNSGKILTVGNSLIDRYSNQLTSDNMFGNLLPTSSSTSSSQASKLICQPDLQAGVGSGRSYSSVLNTQDLSAPSSMNPKSQHGPLNMFDIQQQASSGSGSVFGTESSLNPMNNRQSSQQRQRHPNEFFSQQKNQQFYPQPQYHASNSSQTVSNHDKTSLGSIGNTYFPRNNNLGEKSNTSSANGPRRRNKLPFFTNAISSADHSMKIDAFGNALIDSDGTERFSRKVFVGGLPPDIDEEEIKASFRRFGSLLVDWPHKAESKSYFPPKGYAFLLFSEEVSVQALIDACLQEDDKLYLCVSSPTIKDKPVQIRPWRLSDADFVMDSTLALDPRKTVFVGGVPRPLKASELATIMNNLYGGVCYAGIDTDPELKYPKGAGRVAFSNHQSYIAAISARFVHLHHSEIDKRVEVKPYVLDDQICDECQGSRCGNKFAPFFCSNITCLQYYCENCWSAVHTQPGREFHKPLVKEGSDRPRGAPFKWC